MDRRIEACSAEDLPTVRTLLRAVGLPVAGLGRHPETSILGVWGGGRLLGCAALEVYEGVGLLRSVAVEADARGAGLGRRLTAAALDVAARRRLSAVYLLTETAEAFFHGQGFAAADRASAPRALQASEEFAVACPAGATCMVYPLGARAGGSLE